MAGRGAFPGEDKGKIDNGRPLSGRRDDAGGDRAAAKAGPAKRARRRATATSHSELGEKLIAGVPARIMRPRLVFISCLVAICAFGLLMVFSASSVEALKEQGSSWYYLFRQAIFMGIGFTAFTLIGTRSIIPWRAFRTGFVNVLWGISVVLLVVVLIVGAGGDTWGASRWIPLGFFNLQPAEFAKPAIIALAAKILADYYEDCSTDTPSFLFAMAVCLGVPAFLIIAEPDLGTTIIVAVTVFAMAYTCGISYKLIGMICVVLFVAVVGLAIASPYRFARLLVFLDPWSDPYGDGYQATLAIMAFASGGPFGRGIGNATMKYNYLPEAHNDYILAIIGEELGFVGTALFVLVFLAMIAAGFYIARRSPTLHGQLVATGCSFILLIQFIINSFGILGLLPMTGKPLPFISYGGSSVLTSLILAGLILRVSVESNVETSADRRRAGMSVMGRVAGAVDDRDDVSGHVGRSTAGPALPRSSRGRSDLGAADRPSSRRRPPARRDGGLSVYDGGRSASGDRMGRASGRGGRADARDALGGGYGRIDLGGGAQERLRPRDARPRVDYGDIAGSPRPRRSGDVRRDDMNRYSGRNRYDR